MLTTDLAQVCHGVRVSYLLDSPALAPYEDHLCQVDWSQVFREVLNNTGLAAIVNFDVSYIKYIICHMLNSFIL